MRTLLSVLYAVLLPTLSGSIIFTRDAPGVQQTSVPQAKTETFDGLANGPLGTYISPIGTYSDGAAVSAGNVVGGSLQSTYVAVGVQSGKTDYSLTFPGLQTYFGFYWTAGDVDNRVDFFAGSALKGTFNVGDIINGLPVAYFGNPNIGGNVNEPYVYMNFTAVDEDSRFDKVVFHNNLTVHSGFETDNHSVFDEQVDPPGLPEPASMFLMGTGVCALLVYAARRKRA